MGFLDKVYRLAVMKNYVMIGNGLQCGKQKIVNVLTCYSSNQAMIGCLLASCTGHGDWRVNPNVHDVVQPWRRGCTLFKTVQRCGKFGASFCHKHGGMNFLVNKVVPCGWMVTLMEDWEVIFQNMIGLQIFGRRLIVFGSGRIRLFITRRMKFQMTERR